MFSFSKYCTLYISNMATTYIAIQYAFGTFASNQNKFAECEFCSVFCSLYSDFKDPDSLLRRKTVPFQHNLRGTDNLFKHHFQQLNFKLRYISFTTCTRIKFTEFSVCFCFISVLLSASNTAEWKQLYYKFSICQHLKRTNSKLIKRERSAR